MALTVTVGKHPYQDGTSGYRAELEEIAGLLAKDGITWAPPDAEVGTLFHGDLPYSFVHYLRRVFALHDNGLPVTPAAGQGDLDSARPQVIRTTEMLDSHLLCHSDYDGYYVPVDLDEPLPRVASAVHLMAELVAIAPLIGIRLGADGSPPRPDEDDDYATERETWLVLHDACRASLDSGHPIVFS